MYAAIKIVENESDSEEAVVYTKPTILTQTSKVMQAKYRT